MAIAAQQLGSTEDPGATVLGACRVAVPVAPTSPLGGSSPAAGASLAARAVQSGHGVAGRPRR